MAAALPAGLKLSSQSRLVIHPEAIDSKLNTVDSRSKDLFQAIQTRGGIQLSEAGPILDLKNPQRWVNQLLEAQLVVSEEEWKERYRPKMERTIRLHDDFRNEEVLMELLSQLDARAPKQARILEAFLALSKSSEGVFDDVLNEKQVLSHAEAATSTLKRMEQKGIWQRDERPVKGELSTKKSEQKPLPELSDMQLQAFRLLAASRENKRMALLHGVTGSGKTEVYIHLIADALERGQTVLFLVPEIALTTQLIQRMAIHFERYMHVYHSRFTTREQTETWLSVLGKPGAQKTPQLIIGPRSALFLPMQNLGLIVVDEEHEPSFKQFDPAPRYQARGRRHVDGPKRPLRF